MNMKTPTHQAIVPVLLSGGAGSRLWPVSRALYPKQVLPLLGASSPLQDTAKRFSDGARFAAPIVVCNTDHRFIIAEQLHAQGQPPAALILEPVGRNTAPAAAVAAMMAMERDPQAVMLLAPADHAIGKLDAFLAAIDQALPAARAGHLVTFGVTPTEPHTGYGYIQAGDPIAAGDQVRTVARFIEKPDAATAKDLVAAGDNLWNAGLFMFTAASFLEELTRFHPDIVDQCRAAIAAGHADLDFFRLDEDAFAASPAISIDYAVMEKTDRAAVVPVDMAWSDVGSWSALWQVSDQDQAGNAVGGDVLLHDVERSLVRSEGRLVAALGLKDMLVVETADAVLVAPKDRSEEVKVLVDRLKTLDRSEWESHTRQYRPWGHFETVNAGPRYQVKLLHVKPGAILSLQMHHHRAEHWVVVRGTARVTRGTEELLLTENQSTFIPLGVRHRLENPGKVALELIEVQSGAYLGEDDIVRFEDLYNREG